MAPEDSIDAGSAENDFAVKAIMECFPAKHPGEPEFVDENIEFRRHLVLGWGLPDGDGVSLIHDETRYSSTESIYFLWSIFWTFIHQNNMNDEHLGSLTTFT